jgi:hypothetical protein
MYRRIGWWCVLWALMVTLSGPALAQSAKAMEELVEVSMLVNGDVTVDPTGKVVSYTIQDEKALPAGALAFLKRSVEGWAFEPPKMEGEAITLENGMRLLLVAKRVEGESYQMRIQAASFDPPRQEGYTLRSRKLDPPQYPYAAAMVGMQGTVYLVLKIGRDGKVLQAVAEQVNLTRLASGPVMSRFRALLADSALKAARGWEFEPPIRGDDAKEDFWTVRIPAAFTMVGEEPRYGTWVPYVPGPRKKAPWLDPDVPGESPEALAGGEPSLLGTPMLRLRTPVSWDG